MSGDVAAAARTGLRVEVLGGLRVLVDGRAVDLRGRQRRRLVALLVVAQGRPVPVAGWLAWVGLRAGLRALV